MRTKISCISSKKHKEWTTGQSFFGELKGGNIFNLPINYCERLKKDGKAMIFKELSKYVTFEVAVGINGKIWIKSQQEKNVILLYNLIKKAQHMTQD